METRIFFSYLDIVLLLEEWTVHRRTQRGLWPHQRELMRSLPVSWEGFER